MAKLDMSLGDKAVAALARYELARKTVASLSARICAALERCPISKKNLDWSDPDVRAGKLMDSHGRTKTHLWWALNEKTASDCGWGERLLHADEIEEYLYPSSTDGCRHCYRAFRLIRERKGAREQFGHAKRMISRIGKNAISMLEKSK